MIKSLGVETRSSNGELRNQSQITDEVIGKLAAMENTSERNAMAAKIFGTSWKDLAPILGLGAERIAQLREEAHQNNLIVGEEGLNAANNARIAADKLTASWDAAKLKITADLAPAIEKTLIPALERLVQGTIKGMDAMSFGSEIGFFEVLKGNILKADAKIFGKFLGAEKRYDKWKARMANKLRDKGAFDNMPTLDELMWGKSDGDSEDFIIPAIKAAGAIETVEQRINELKKSIKSASEGELPALNTELEKLTAELKRLQDLRLPEKLLPPELVENIKQLKTTDPILPGLPETLEKYKEKASEVIDPAQNLRDGTHALTKQLAEMAQQGTMSFNELTQAGVGSARQLIRAFLAQSIAKAIAGSIKMGPAGLLLAGVAAAGITSLFDKLLPKFAGGGDTPKGPMIVGERGPEIFMPGVRGHVMANHTLQGAFSGGSSNVNVAVSGAMRASQFYLMGQRGRDSRSWRT
jgi:hypothetical protein